MTSTTKKIAIVHPEGNLNNNPNLSGLTEILCEQAYEVHYYCRKSENVSQYPPCAGATIIPFTGSTFNLSDRYDLVIGVDEGIIPASAIAAKLEVPYGLISYEIFFADEIGLPRKLPEIEACQNLAFAVCQDRVRSRQLAQENQIPLTKIIDIPVAGRNIIRGERTCYFHDKLGLERNKKILLYIGSVEAKWSMIDELVATTPEWDDSWVLVLHHRYGQSADLLTSITARYPSAKNIYASPAPALPLEEMHHLLHAADLSAAFYQPQYTQPTDGKNLLHIGMASGKIATSLQHGLPIVVNAIGEMSEYVKQFQLGCVVETMADLPGQLQLMGRQSTSDYRQQCYQFFTDTLDLNITSQPLLALIKQLVPQPVIPAEWPKPSNTNTQPAPAAAPAKAEYLVSAIVSTYNAENFIQACLQDLVDQTLYQRGELEIIVIDSNSPQNERAIVEAFQQRYPHFVYHRTQERETLYAAWNRGIHLARGKYITNANTDDAHRPDALERLAAALEAYPEADLAYAHCAWTDVPNDTFQNSHAYREVRYPPYTPALSPLYCFLGPHPLWRRTVFDKIGLFNPTLKAVSDYEFQLRFTLEGLQAVLVPEVLSLFYQNQQGLTAQADQNSQELEPLYAQYRAQMPIGRLYAVDPADRASVAQAWVSQGNLALSFDCPWLDQPASRVDYALHCYQTARLCDPDYFPAFHNLFALLAHLGQWASCAGLAEQAPPAHLEQYHAAISRQQPPTFMAVNSPSAVSPLVMSPASVPAEVVEPVGSRPSIFWAANIFDFSGYAWLSRQLLPTLAQHEVSLQIESFTSDETLLAQTATRPNQLATWQRLLDNNIEPELCVVFQPPTTWQQQDFFAEYRRHRSGFAAYVGLTMFETDRLPAGWAAACNGMDEVWVPSTFNRETFTRAGVEPTKLQVIPFGLNTAVYNPATVTPLDIPGRRGFTFLSVFQWSQRKGWDILIKAYLQAFTAADEVCLVIRAYPGRIKQPPLAQRLDAYVRQLGYDPAAIPPIILLEQFISELDMPALYAAADAFVLPTRGEGWGVPFMEAMAMGLPTIATRWSAHLDFMNDANSYLIDLDGLEPVAAEQTKEDPFYTPDQMWAKPSLPETVRLMRHVFENQAEARAKGGQARRHIQQHWSLQRTAAWVIERSQIVLGHQAGPATAAKPTPANLRPVLWHAPIYDPSGYADEARNFILQLRRQGQPIAARKAGRDSEKFRSQLDAVTRHHLDEALQTPAEAPFISLIHFPAYAFQRLPDAAYNIGRVMFETDGLPADWVAKCNQMDEIWVPTTFNLETFRAAGVTAKLTKIPGGIDTDQFRPGVEPLIISGARGTIFLSIFEWIYRKGWDVLLRAWATAFAPADDVTLVLRTYPINSTDLPDTKREIERRIDHFLHSELGLTRGQVAPIIIIAEQVPEQDLPRLFAAATAYVSCSRGEGWGRPQMQAMACGLPVIATGWGGNLEFMTDANSLLLKVEALVEIDERSEIPFYRGQRWAEPSTTHLATLLRQIYDHPAQAATIGRQARHHMLGKWQWATSAALAAERLQAIQTELAATPAPQPPLAVRWEGSQFVTHSLALINRELCLRLAQTEQLELSIIPYERHQFGGEVDPRFAQIERRLNRPLARPADVHVRHQWPPNFTPPAEGHWVMIQPWEFGSVPQQWISVMREQVDEVWAYTNYVRNCYLRSGLPEDRVFVVPPGVDTAKFRPEAPPLALRSRKRFKFLFVGGTIARKGIDILLDVYARTFTAADDVCLVIKDMGGQSFYQGQTAQELIAKMQAKPTAPEIEYIDRTLADSDLAGLYTACDCLVHPYRGEGFGLPIAEAMACGLPVIVTGYGAALDFCNSSNAYLIPAPEVKLPQKQIGEWATVDYPWWAEPDQGALQRLLQHVLANPGQAQAKGQAGLAHIRQNFTWDHAALAVNQRLAHLRDRPIRRLKDEQLPSHVRPAHHQNGTTPSSPPTSGGTMAHDGILNQMIASAQAAGRWHQAISLLQEAVKYAPAGPAQAELWNSLGYSCFQANQIDEAEAAFKEGLQNDPRSPDILLNLIQLYRQQEQPDQATATINRALRVDPDNVEVLLQLGECAIELGALDVALLTFERIKTLAPDTPGLDQLVAELSGGAPAVNGAGNGVAPVIDAASSAQQAANQALAKGQAALAANDLMAAAQEFAWVTAQYPDLAAGHMALGSTLLALGRTEAALTPLRRVTELLPELAAGYNQWGVACYRAGHQAEAETAFKQACQRDPLDLEPCLNLVDLYRGQRRFEEARAAVEMALSLEANHPEVQIATGLVNAELGNFAEARRSLTVLEAVAPTHPGVAALRSLVAGPAHPPPDLIGQIEAAQATGNWPRAITLLKAALTQPGHQADPALWNSLGVSYFQAGHMSEAETTLAHGLKLDPENLDLLSNLADLYLQQEEFDRATEYVNKALRVDPNHIEALIVLGHCCIQLGVYDTALTAFHQVQTLAPETAGIAQVVTELETMAVVPV